MGFGCDEFGYCVCEGGVGADVEDGVGIFAVVHAAGREDDGDEVDAGVFEEGGGGGGGEELEELMELGFEGLSEGRLTLTSTLEMLPTTLY